jgi:hypothetical protein
MLDFANVVRGHERSFNFDNFFVEIAGITINAAGYPIVTALNGCANRSAHTCVRLL